MSEKAEKGSRWRHREKSIEVMVTNPFVRVRDPVWGWGDGLSYVHADEPEGQTFVRLVTDFHDNFARVP